MGIFEFGAKRLVLNQGIYHCEGSCPSLITDGEMPEEPLILSKFFDIVMSSHYFISNISAYELNHKWHIKNEILELLEDKKIKKSKFCILPNTVFLDKNGKHLIAFIQENSYVPDFLLNESITDFGSTHKFFYDLKETILEIDKLGLSTKDLDFKDFSIKKRFGREKVLFSNFLKLKKKSEDEDIDNNLKNIISTYFAYIKDTKYSRTEMYMLFGKEAVDFFLSSDNFTIDELNKVLSTITISNNIEVCESCGFAYDKSIFSFCPHCNNIKDCDGDETNEEETLSFTIPLENTKESYEFLCNVLSLFEILLRNTINLEGKGILFNFEKKSFEGFYFTLGDLSKKQKKIKMHNVDQLYSISSYLEEQNIDIGERNAGIISSISGFFITDIRLDEIKVTEKDNISVYQFQKAILDYLKSQGGFKIEEEGKFNFVGNNQIFDYGFGFFKAFLDYILTGNVALTGYDCNEYWMPSTLEFLSEKNLVISSKIHNDSIFCESNAKIDDSDTEYVYRTYKRTKFDFYSLCASLTKFNRCGMFSYLPNFKVILGEVLPSSEEFCIKGFLYEKRELCSIGDIQKVRHLNNKEKLGLTIRSLRFANLTSGYLGTVSWLLSLKNFSKYFNMLGVDEKTLKVYINDYDQFARFSKSNGVIPMPDFIEEVLDSYSDVLAFDPFDIDSAINLLYEKYKSLKYHCAVHNHFYSDDDFQCPICYPNTIFVDEDMFDARRNTLKSCDDRYEIHYIKNAKLYNVFYNFRLKEDKREDSKTVLRLIEISKSHDDIKIVRLKSTKEILGYASINSYLPSNGEFEIKESLFIKGNDLYKFIFSIFKNFLNHSEKIQRNIKEIGIERCIKGVFVNDHLKECILTDPLSIIRIEGEEMLTEKDIYDIFYSFIATDKTFKMLSFDPSKGDARSLLDIIEKLYHKNKLYCKKHDICYMEDSLCPICYKKIGGKIKKFDPNDAREPFKDGAEANIYETSDPKYVEKIFNKYSTVGDSKELTVNLDRKINIIFRLMQKAEEVNFNRKNEGFEVFTPEYVSVNIDTQKPCGYWMKRLPKNSYPFIYLTDASFVAQKEYDLEFILKLLKNFGAAINFLHQNGMYIGDVSGTNVHFDEEGIVYIIDVDSNGIDEYKSVMYTSIFADPNAFTSETSMTTTPTTDWYSYAIISFMCIFRAHPFKGIYFENVDGKYKVMKTEDRMKNKISILNSTHDVKIPSVALPFDIVSDELFKAFFRLFETDERFSIWSYIIKEYNHITKNSVEELAEEIVSDKIQENTDEKIETTSKQHSEDNPYFTITKLEGDELEKAIITIKEIKQFMASKKGFVSLFNGKNNFVLEYKKSSLEYSVRNRLNGTIVEDSNSLPSSCKGKCLSFFGNNIYFCREGEICGVNIQNHAKAKWSCQVSHNDSEIYNMGGCFYIVNPESYYCLRPK